MKAKNKELQKLAEYEHGTSNKKNANEEQYGGWKQKTKKSEDQDAKILEVAYSKMKEVSEERITTLHNTYIFFLPAKPKIKK